MQSRFEDESDDDPAGRAERLIAEGQPERAVSLLRERIQARHGGLLAHLALVKALIAAGDAEQAVEVARETARINPDVAAAAVALGKVLAGAGRLPAAIAEFQRALRIEPHLAVARAELGRAWLEAGETDRAGEAFAHISPVEFPDVAELVLRAEKMRARTRSDPGYVRHLFDQFSADYDKRMRRELSYAAPEILKSLAALVMPGRTALSILDLGCGTGLSGAAFKPVARRLEGVDLSAEMIAQARARGIYDELIVGDVESEPVDGGPYDLVLAADTLVYLGDLEPVLTHVVRFLQPGGFFLFTVEKEEDGEDFSLGPKRRWRHSQSYLRKVSERSGFTIAGMLACAPRTEAGTPVQGLAVALEKET